MKRSNKKGFTTVELVIVIAVIAILAAVLIPTFANLVEKANQSVDQQAIRNINVVLKTEEAAGNIPNEIREVKSILGENGFATDLAPMYDGYTFGWIAEDNVAVLIKDEAIVYPEDYTGRDYDEVELFNVVKVSTSDAVKDLANGTFAQTGFNSIIVEKDLKVEGTDVNGNYLEFSNVGDIEIAGDGTVLKANVNVSSGTSLTLSDITIDSTETGKNNCSAIKPLDGAIYISDVTVVAPLFGFAQNAGQSSEAVSGEVKDSTFDAPVALYVAQGDWVFENCHFKGTITIAGGNVTFKNCTFEAKAAEATGYRYDNAVFKTSGAYFLDSAIVIVDGRTTESYQSGNVSFVNCTVKNVDAATGTYLKIGNTSSDGNVVTVDDSGLKLAS